MTAQRLQAVAGQDARRAPEQEALSDKDSEKGFVRFLPKVLQAERNRWYTPEPSVRRVHWLRLALVLVALVNAAAHLFALPGATHEVTLWLDGEVALYVLIAMIYLLGLRMWYLPAIGYTVVNMVAFFVSGFVAIPGISSAALTGHLAFAQYYFGRGFSVGAWVFLLVVGAIMLRLDNGSKLNELLRDS
ncbi:MAG: hypothetical protein ACYDH5_14395 [Acidimicrobiales bacterium]